jgi:hypothetical protein
MRNAECGTGNNARKTLKIERQTLKKQKIDARKNIASPKPFVASNRTSSSSPLNGEMAGVRGVDSQNLAIIPGINFRSTP